MAALASRLALCATACGGFGLDPTASMASVHSCVRRGAPTASSIAFFTNWFLNSSSVKNSEAVEATGAPVVMK